MILRAYKVQLDINNKQQTLLLQHLGCARWAFNWAINSSGELVKINKNLEVKPVTVGDNFAKRKEGNPVD